MPDSKLSRPLRVFLCHSSADKPAVRELYQRLQSDGFEPWLDEEDLIPGQAWQHEIPRAVRKSDAVIVCLSHNSVKAGYIQKEIQFAIDLADEQPEDTIFIIPLKLEECKVPDRLSRWHWVNYFSPNGHSKLLRALNARATSFDINASSSATEPSSEDGFASQSDLPATNQSGGINVDAAQVSVGQDVVGRDKVVSAGGHIIHAENGATIIINEQLASTTKQPVDDRSTSEIASIDQMQKLPHRDWIRGGLVAFLIIAAVLAIVLLSAAEGIPTNFGDGTLPLRSTIMPQPFAGLITEEPPPAQLPDDSTPVANVPVHKPTPVDLTGGVPTRIVIPTINLDAPVEALGWYTVDGVSNWAVPDHFAAGWLVNSATLGKPGNTAITGHHNVGGEVFRNLVKLQPGDRITLYAQDYPYYYEVDSRRILPERGQSDEVRQANARWIQPTNDERVTLVTCWPYTSNTHRLIIVAKPIKP